MRTNELMKSLQETSHLRQKKRMSKKIPLRIIQIIFKRFLLFDFNLVLVFFLSVCVCETAKIIIIVQSRCRLRADLVSASVSIAKMKRKKKHCSWMEVHEFVFRHQMRQAYIIFFSMIFVAIPLPLRVEWIRLTRLNSLVVWISYQIRALHCIASQHQSTHSKLMCLLMCVFCCCCWFHCKFLLMSTCPQIVFGFSLSFNFAA